MWFIFNIVILNIFIITRFFCYVITFKALKYDKYFYERNPIMKKILKCRGGKILAMIIGFLPLLVFIIITFIFQMLYPTFMWIFTIVILILIIPFILDFLNDVITYFLKYRRIKYEVG